MFLSLRQISKRFGRVVALDNISLDIEEGELVCFLGPSGCGKTTLLRIIAGLELPDNGETRLQDVDLTGVPARLRNFGVVFQSYSLFPNMSVAKNVAYGLECHKWSAADIERRVKEMLTLVRLEDQAAKYPHQLSGGQQQRIALARALAPNPSVLLLDEPLSALDARVREDLRAEIRDLQTRLGITTVMVTHDQHEAMEIADRIVVMNAGVIEQVGRPIELYDRPLTRFVAEFIGRMNLLRLPANGLGERAGCATESAVVGIRPEHIELLTTESAARANIVGRVEKCVFLGSITRVTLLAEDQRLLLELHGKPPDLSPGAILALRIPEEAIHRLEDAGR